MTSEHVPALPSFRTVTRRTVSSDIADQLQALILDGHYKPGDRLPSHQELAKRLNVGLSSVREAVSALAAAGLLDARPGQGTFVTGLARATFLPASTPEQLSDSEVTDLVELRRVLEGLVIRCVMERAADDDLTPLDRAVEQMRAAHDDPDAFAAGDLEFHIQLARAAKNLALLRAMAALAPLLRVEMTMNAAAAMRSVGDLSFALSSHVRLLAALRNREKREAEHGLDEVLRRASFYAEARRHGDQIDSELETR